MEATGYPGTYYGQRYDSYPRTYYGQRYYGYPGTYYGQSWGNRWGNNNRNLVSVFKREAEADASAQYLSYYGSPAPGSYYGSYYGYPGSYYGQRYYSYPRTYYGQQYYGYPGTYYGQRWGNRWGNNNRYPVSVFKREAEAEAEADASAQYLSNYVSPGSYQGYNQGNNQGYTQGYDQQNLMGIGMYNLADNVDPAILTESQILLLNMIQRTKELIDNMPNTAETARELSYLWGNAFPQLRTLLPKAGAWANQAPVPSGAGVSVFKREAEAEADPAYYRTYGYGLPYFYTRGYHPYRPSRYSYG